MCRLQILLNEGMHKSMAFPKMWLLRDYPRQIVDFGNCAIASTSYGEHSNKEFKDHVAFSNGHPETRITQVPCLLRKQNVEKHILYIRKFPKAEIRVVEEHPHTQLLTCYLVRHAYDLKFMMSYSMNPGTKNVPVSL